ncbi:MAG TPA: hypothetical protein VKB80_01760 [Kofleriaceae bacterium]|nr:hypothetical protein [Kofleriaceae bacterium]
MPGRPRAPRAAAALLLAATAAAAADRPARAAPPAAALAPVASAAARERTGLELVPSDAAVVVRADPAELERIAALVRSFGGDVGMAANAVSLASASALGFDALAVAGWRSIGIDAQQPVFIALLPIDPAAPRALWHARAVARIADPRAFDGWAARSPLLAEPWRAATPVVGALGALLGIAGDARAEAAAARALTERGTLAVGMSPRLGALMLVRRDGAYAVLDAFALTEIGHLTWPRDGAAVLAGLEAVQRPTMVDRTTAGTAALGRPGLVFWTQPAGLFDAAIAWSRPPPTCDDFRDLAARTALVDASLALRVAQHQIALDLLWGSPPGAPVTAAWPLADDGLIGPPLRGGAVLAATLYLAGTARLRAMPRHSLVEGGWNPLWRRARSCGRTARGLLLGFAWPEVAGQWLGEVAAVSPSTARVVGSARNIAFAARRVSAEDRRAWQAVLEASLAPDGMGPADAVLDAVFGGRRPVRRPRPHLAWQGRYLHPYSIARGRRGIVVGVAIGDRARRWRLEQPLRARRAGPRTLARAAGDGAALLRQLAPALPPPWRALAAAGATRVGSLSMIVTVQPDGVQVSATVRRR